MSELPRLLIGRHGQCTDNAAGRLNGRRDTELTELGRAQVLQTATALSETEHDISTIYASTLSRSYDSARIYADQLGVGYPIMLPVLKERHLGNVTGLTIEEAKERIAPEHLIQAQGTTYAEDPRYGFETFAQTDERAGRFLKYLKRTHNATETVLVVAHGDINMALCAVAIGSCMAEMIYELYIPNGGLVCVEDGEIHDVELTVGV